MKKTVALIFILCLIVQLTMAQKRSISGVVREKETNESLPGVSVLEKGTRTGTVTNVDGKFQLSVNEGAVLVFSFVGMKSQEVKVGQSSKLEIFIESDTHQVDEIMVTAEFGMKRVARSIGSSVQNVKASDIAESGRDNFVSALQGRVAGMNVSSSSGAPGASTKVVLRSITSISGNNQPLYVVDGVPMNNSTFNPINMADGGTNFSVRNLDFASRGNDFNPEDIESMTVLKGASAAALYGSDASNGAIIITTKKGKSGKGEVTYSNTFRWEKSYDFPEIQTKYAQGAYGTTNYYYTNRYGGLYPEGTPLYDNLGTMFQTGFSSKHNISMEAGNDKSSIRAAASFLDQSGVVKTSDFSRFNISLAGKAEITKWMNFESSMQFTSTKNNKVPEGTSGPLYMSMRWPMVDNMLDYMDKDGSHMRMANYYVDTDLLNPLYGLKKNKLYDSSDRIISNLAVNITPLKNAFLRAQLGWDVGMQNFETSTHPYYYNNNAGSGFYSLTKRNFSDPTLNFLAGYSTDFLDKKFTFSGQVGYHQIENGVSQLASSGTKYMVIDFQSINNCDPASVTSKKTDTKRRIQAISAQFELGYKNMAFVTLRARNDWSSTLPKDNNSYFYPAVEGSFVATELPVLKNNKYIN